MPRLRSNLGKLSMLLATVRAVRGLYQFNKDTSFSTLIYHDIPPQQLSDFQEQLVLASKCFGFIDPTQLPAMMGKGSSPIGCKLLLTFDDGFKSNREVAENILDALGIKAVFFVMPDFLSCHEKGQQQDFIARNIYDSNISPEGLPEHLKPMGWADLEYLLTKGHCIGAHTRSHRRLSEIKSQDELEEEIIGSGDLLEAKLGVPIEYFAFPFGDIASINPAALAVAGRRYRYVFSGVRGRNRPGVHPLAIRREAVSLDDSIPYYRLILEGGLDAYYYFKRKSLDTMAILASREFSVLEKGGV